MTAGRRPPTAGLQLWAARIFYNFTIIYLHARQASREEQILSREKTPLQPYTARGGIINDDFCVCRIHITYLFSPVLQYDLHDKMVRV